MTRLIVLASMCLLLAPRPVAAQWQADPGSRIQVKAQRTLQAFRERIPRTTTYFDDAYALAVFPSVTRVGFGFGGAYGKGIVIEGDRLVGSTKYWQFTSGIQAGARNFGMIVFFRDKAALEYYQTSKTQFLGQAGIAVLTAGVAGTPSYDEGVAIVTLTRLGLMAEFTVSGAKFSYVPLVAE